MEICQKQRTTDFPKDGIFSIDGEEDKPFGKTCRMINGNIVVHFFRVGDSGVLSPITKRIIAYVLGGSNCFVIVYVLGGSNCFVIDIDPYVIACNSHVII